MTEGSSRELFSRSFESAWAHTLANIPNLLGRLVYLSSLRDIQTVKYEHHGLVARYGDEAVQRAILASHREVFSSWLDQSIAAQRKILAEYLEGLPDSNTHEVIHRWLSVAFYRNWIPVGAPDFQQQLYLTDFETLLQILSREMPKGARRPKSSRGRSPGR